MIDCQKYFTGKAHAQSFGRRILVRTGRHWGGLCVVDGGEPVLRMFFVIKVIKCDTSNRNVCEISENGPNFIDEVGKTDKAGGKRYKRQNGKRNVES